MRNAQVWETESLDHASSTVSARGWRMCEWLWLTGGELWSGVRDSGDERLAARVVLFGGILMVLAVPLTLAGSGTGG